VADILQIGFEGRAVRHCKYHRSSFPNLSCLLLNLQDSNRSASKDPAGISRSIVDDQYVKRITVLRLRRRNEAPIVRIRETIKGLASMKTSEVASGKLDFDPV
jgi:hypothetical protein